jgi:hypothetical protein
VLEVVLVAVLEEQPPYKAFALERNHSLPLARLKLVQVEVTGAGVQPLLSSNHQSRLHSNRFLHQWKRWQHWVLVKRALHLLPQQLLPPQLLAVGLEVEVEGAASQ